MKQRPKVNTNSVRCERVRSVVAVEFVVTGEKRVFSVDVIVSERSHRHR